MNSVPSFLCFQFFLIFEEILYNGSFRRFLKASNIHFKRGDNQSAYSKLFRKSYLGLAENFALSYILKEKIIWKRKSVSSVLAPAIGSTRVKHFTLLSVFFFSPSLVKSNKIGKMIQNSSRRFLIKFSKKNLGLDDVTMPYCFNFLSLFFVLR